MLRKITITLCAFCFIALSSGEALAQRNRTRTGANGGTAVSTGQVQRQGGGAYSNSGQKTWTGPNGNNGSATTSGNGKWSRTENGANNTYNGQVTTGQGNTYDVDHQADYGYDQDDGVTRDGSTEVTNEQGETLGTGSSSGSAKYGEGYQSERTQTGPQGRATTKSTRGGRNGSGFYRDIER